MDFIIDSSAVVAIALSEPGEEWLRDQLTIANRRLLSAPTRVELGMVLEARLPDTGRDAAEDLIRRLGVEIVPFTPDLADRALTAWRRYGKGRHPASLNLGDCFSYALAEQTGHPLLCIGNDFAQTPLNILTPPPDAQ